MGIIDFVKGGVREMMVARPDAQKNLIVYKHPDGNIPTYSRLTIDMDECAVFFKSGSPPTVAALGPGRYPLSTENIPFLNNFLTNPFSLVGDLLMIAAVLTGPILWLMLRNGPAIASAAGQVAPLLLV